ncbi:hypothetical protein DevBK_07245 [Devosia sp. BK]|uniref:hypothetical protein n=1 Tax=Devosia sp. BK TaxID=2871706 RepID=UPI00293B7FDC|nr:hypothetical protein [Devosia sp. BK]MDV3251118.1 hypothetical protein [Devosia sp. BK]
MNTQSITRTTIDLWNADSFDQKLRELLDAKAELLVSYFDTENANFLAYDHARGSDRLASRPSNPYATEFLSFVEGLGRWMESRSIRAFHCTRMTNEEVKSLLKSGIELSTPETLRRRLDALVDAGHLSADKADVAFDDSPFQGDQLEFRSGIFWLTSHPLVPYEGGTEDLLGRWGGEVASFWTEDNELIETLSRIGTPRILEIAVPLHATHHSYAAANTVVRTFARSRGALPDKGAFDLYTEQPLPATAVLAVHSEGDADFIAMGTTYPDSYVDINVGRWKELTGEDD